MKKHEVVLFCLKQALCVQLCNVIDEFSGVFPSKTWIGNGFTVNMLADLLAAFFDIAFDHKPFHKTIDLGR